MNTDLSDLTDHLLHAAQKAGATAADAIAVGGTPMEISVRAGALEQADSSEGTELGRKILM